MITDIRENNYKGRLDAALSNNGPDDDMWNERLLVRLAAVGLKIAPIASKHHTGRYGAYWAPVPCDKGKQYVYPSVIVEQDDMTEYTS